MPQRVATEESYARGEIDASGETGNAQALSSGAGRRAGGPSTRPCSRVLNDTELNHRERAALRAVALGQAEMTCSCEPDLFIDGLAFCDQPTAHHLANSGLITPARTARHGERVPALLTDVGRAALGVQPVLAA